jgi:hypothetical protein
LLYFTTNYSFYAAICAHPGVCDVLIITQFELLNVEVPPTSVKVPFGGDITLATTTEEAIPVNVTVPTLGVTTLPVTTTLGAEPTITAPPDGVTILPLTTLGA